MSNQGRSRENTKTSPQVNQWIADVSNTTNFTGRLASRSKMPSYSTPLNAGNRGVRPVTSEVSSISYARANVSYVSSSRSSNVAPSLTRSGNTLSSRSSAATSKVSEVIQTRLLESDSEEEGALNLPTRQFREDPEYPCIFEFLDCTSQFNDTRTWATHVLSHFHGHTPPPNAVCCLCEKKFSSCDGRNAWSLYLQHIASFHFHQGQRLSTARPDFNLIRWMYSRKIIDKRVVSAMQLEPPAEGATVPGSRRSTAYAGRRDEPVLISANARSEARDRNGARGVRRVR